MESITLKEIAGYLPYGLKIQCYTDDEIKKQGSYISTITGISITGIDDSFGNNWDFSVRPILNHLSMLTQEIEHNGEKIIPIEWIRKNINEKIHFSDDRFMDYADGKDKKVLHYSFYDVHSDSVDIDEILQLIQKLQEWHIDYQDLIGRGVAIDKSKI